MAEMIAERNGFRPVVIKDTDDLVGIVTVHDGPSLAQDEIIAPVVGNNPAQTETYHNNFQNPDRFLRAGGHARTAAPGAGRRHLLCQPRVCHRGDDLQDDHRCGHGRGGRLLHRRGRAPTCRASTIATASWSTVGSAACGVSRSCPASTPSIPTPARWSPCRRPTSS